MTVNSDQPLLERCPFCDYALEGLPVKHVCPECGQPFDRRWRVFGVTSSWKASDRSGRRGMVFMLAVFLVFGVVSVLATGSVAVGVVSAVVMGGAYAYKVFTRPDMFVAVGSDELVVGSRGRRLQWHYPLLEIRRARLDRLDSVVFETPLRDIRGDLRHRDEAARCAQYVNSCIRAGQNGDRHQVRLPDEPAGNG